jgi:transcriptional regulator GlxA family with amidase domain
MNAAAAPTGVQVIVVVPPNLLLLDVAGPIEVLRKANLEQSHVRFDVSYVGPVSKVHSSIGLTLSGISPLPEHVPAGALVVIAGTADQPLGDLDSSRDHDAVHEAAIIAWLRRSIRPGVRLATICSGALFAARAGLLDGYECTTHHGCMEELARFAPAARIKDNRLFVEDGERLTSAGITSGVDMMLHLVAKELGHLVSLSVARYLVVYLRRDAGSPQLSPWLEGRNHIHPAIHRAQDAIAANPARKWSVDRLASVSATSPRHLSRLFNDHAGMSVIEYVSRTRIALAREILTSSRLDMAAVARRSGFGSARQLRRAWSRFHDVPPSRMRIAKPMVEREGSV